MPRLQVLNGKRQGATFEVGRGGVVVGHRNTAPVSIDDPWVSWDHAKIFQQNDAFWIEDLGSTNGTFVNCVRVKRERLNHEDIIFFGKTHVIFLVAEMATNDGESSPSEEKKRSSFEVNVQAVAAAAGFKNGRSGTGTAINMPRADELPLAPQGFAGGFEPGEDSSRSRRDPFRPGADPWEQRIPPNKGSSGLVNLDPEADPFSSARAENAKGADPFTVGADPFDGPRQRSVADTQHDLDDDSAPRSPRPTSEDGSYPTSRSPAGMGNFEIDEFEPDNVAVTPVSAAEVSSLLKTQKSSDGEEANLDDLDVLLGDNAARTPDPGLYRAPGTGKLKKGSEALTRPIDTQAARDALGDKPADKPPEKPRNSPSKTTLDLNGPAVPAPGSGSSKFSAPPVPPTAPGAPGAAARSGTGRIAPLPPEMASNARTQPLQAQNPVPPPPPPPPPAAPKVDESRPAATADLAFEVAKLQDEVRRLRMALDAARQADPEKVRVAVEGLRAEELGRQAREIAELRGELTSVKETHKKTLAELDDVTADMINKEDEIDSLKKKLGVREGAPRAPSAGASADELRALEF
ncbi:MAG: FHA domain-containing protein [Planctomycetota bacterium]